VRAFPATEAGRKRVVIEDVRPEIDAGRFPIKRTAGGRVRVEADLFGDGHDAVAGDLLHRRAGSAHWQRVRLQPLTNDRWHAEFRVGEAGRHEYTLQGWIDPLETWRRDLSKRLQAGQDVTAELPEGARLLEAAAQRAASAGARLEEAARWLRDAPPEGSSAAAKRALDPDVADAARAHPDLAHATTYDRVLTVTIDPPRAAASAWYEFFPRSAALEAGRHGTLRDAARRLPYIADLGFDTVYLPPIHPIGITHRKGRGNAPKAGPGDVGSAWAIGGPEGGHTSVHPQLGTVEDLEVFVRVARELGLETSIDLALQASPDHPWVREHPQWFRRREDGTIRHAENPPKKYEDIYPIDFETDEWRSLWAAVRDVLEFWIARGVRTFRVDNPHTKPFPFWEALLADVRGRHPDVLFLSEAFTRPKVMYRLAKLGFTHSYTYFAWRNARWEIEQYFQELHSYPVREYFRPHLWPNTPDILTTYLQTGGRPAFALRAILAATLAANYGVYGPTYERLEAQAVAPGSEEYLHSEKYELRHWGPSYEGPLSPLLRQVNRIRRENPALQNDDHLCFHRTDNDVILAYSRRTDDRANTILVLANLDPHHTQSGWTDLDLVELGVNAADSFQVHDLLTGDRYLWHGPRNYVELRPRELPVHVLRVRPRLRTERDFDYFA
jgi:starch synthase (maltosyl-transferring)